MKSSPAISSDIEGLAVALVARTVGMLDEHRAMLAKTNKFSSEKSQQSDWVVHFTKDSTALKILLNGPWLCDATTGNDHAEYRHGIEIVWQTLWNAWGFTLEETQALCTSIEDPTRIPLMQIDRIGHMLRKSLYYSERVTGLIFCLSDPLRDAPAHSSELTDNLAMWREYGGEGSGTALVICRPDLSRMTDSHPTGLFEVYYDNAEKQSLCRYLCIATYELLDARKSSCWTKQMAGITRLLSTREILIASRIATGLFALLFKDPCYFYEREIRLLHLSLEGSRKNMDWFENKKTGRWRYYLPWRKLAAPNSVFPVAAIHFGPRARQTAAQKELIKICRERNIPVRNSELPYRGANAPDLSWRQMVQRLVETESSLKRALSKSDTSARQKRIAGHWNAIEAQAKLWSLEHKGTRST